MFVYRVIILSVLTFFGKSIVKRVQMSIVGHEFARYLLVTLIALIYPVSTYIVVYSVFYFILLTTSLTTFTVNIIEKI